MEIAKAVKATMTPKTSHSVTHKYLTFSIIDKKIRPQPVLIEFPCKTPSFCVQNSALGGMAIQTGRVTITPKPNEPTMKKVTFPKPFKSQPGVVMTVISSVPGTNVLGIGTSNNTKDGFEAYVTRINNTETIMVWVAIGPM